MWAEEETVAAEVEQCVVFSMPAEEGIVVVYIG